MKAAARQWAILAFLILVWAGLLLARWGQSAPPTRPADRPAPARTEARAGKARADNSRLRTDLLRAPRPALPDTLKNLFAAVEEPPPPPPPKPVAGAPPPPADPFLEGLKRVKFLGFAREEGRALAFVSRDGEFLMAREKELLLNQYLVVRITEDTITLATPDGSREARLTLSPDSR
ncbi:MAG: hypothetical protein L0214_14935 [candidate division NC10 bacterium]|nr:hypothetical protein [candidate division NC10 bacterium]